VKFTRTFWVVFWALMLGLAIRFGWLLMLDLIK
jgi:hypothetical protein